MGLLILTGVLMTALGRAHEGHSHADAAPEPSVDAAAPRAEAATPDFELVAVREAGRLALYLNAFASNAPVADAAVEVDVGGTSYRALPRGPGIYEVTVPALDGAGQHAMTVSVTTDTLSDLLPLTLTVPATEPGGAATDGWVRGWPWLAGGAIGLVAIGLGLRRKRLGGRPAVVPVLLGAWLVAGLPIPGAAHEGHSHGAETPLPAAAGSRPQRLPGGAVFMPKASQYQLGIRTQVAASAAWPGTLELAGHVLADPAASALVQASQSGRLDGGPRGLPHVGMKVKRGETLAWLTPLASSLERGQLEAARAELASALALAEKRLARLAELEGSVPRKEIEATMLEVDGLRRRQQALSGSLSRREALTAPVAGEIAEVRVSIGQVLEARDVAFTIVDRDRLVIEALAYDPGVAALREATAASLDGKPIRVSFLGIGAQLKEHALPVQFRVTEPAGLVVGQPVKVFIERAAGTTGVKLPREALVRGAAGEAAVWLMERAEVFTLQPVSATSLDAGHVLVTGVADGSRVVVQGAALLGQVK